MIGLALVGAAIGAVLAALAAAVLRPRPSTLVTLGRYYAHYRGPAPTSIGGGSPSGAGRQERIGQWAAGQLATRGIGYPRLRADLAMTGQSLDALLGKKILAGGIGFLGGLLALSAVRYALEAALPTFVPLAGGLALGAGLFLAPDADVRKAATRRRAEFREQLSVFLDLVSLRMAGHAAAATALPEAAQRGGGWPMTLIRDTLFRARRAGQSEWDALAALGERIGVEELRELGGLIRLVADDGAQVRATLTARAASLRRARLADAQAGAEERNQSMRLAQLLIAVGFMIFVGYPAFVSIRF